MCSKIKLQLLASCALVFSFCSAISNNSYCIKSYSQLQEAIVGRKENMQSISNGFYPPNRRAATAANILYYYPGEKQNSFKFRWSASAVNNLMRPELMQDLSLNMFDGHTETIKIEIDLFCEALSVDLAMQLNSYEMCSNDEYNSTHPIHMLNTLTTRLKSFAKDKRLLGVDEASRGYSCYFYNNLKTKDCCVVGQEHTYRKIRMGATTFLIILAFLLFGQVPVLLKVISFLFDKSVECPQASVLHYASATCITALLASIVVYIVLLYKAIIIRLKEANEEADVRFNYYLGLILFNAFPFVVFTLASYKSLKFKLKDTLQAHGFVGTESFVFTCIGITSVIFLQQLMCLCGYAIFLGIVASPLHTLPIILIYISGFFFFTVATAILIKLFRKHFKTSPCTFIFVTITLIIMFVAFITLVFVIHTLITRVGASKTDGSIWSLASALLPSMITSVIFYILGHIGTKMMKWLEVKNERNRGQELKERYQVLRPLKLRTKYEGKKSKTKLLKACKKT